MGALSGAVTAASTILRRNLFSLMQHASRVSDATDERRVA
jgi:hypothetical protein